MIVIVCPAAAVTGGPEALHQLCDSLLRQGHDAAMLYLPGEYHATPEPYQSYRLRTVAEVDVYPSDVVVIPEVMTGEVARFAFARCVVWWLSVDNARGGSLTVAADHVAQSLYAQAHLRDNGISADLLGDYIHPSFAKTGTVRDLFCAHNPSKGREVAERFATVCPDIELRPIEGMGRDEVAAFLNRATVFVDFGHQPGKDRPPREAAMSGCVVFIRDAGAARFREEYRLPDWAFFDESSDGLARLGDRVRAVFKDSPPYFGRQVVYRGDTAREQQLFDEQVARFAARHL